MWKTVQGGRECDERKEERSLWKLPYASSFAIPSRFIFTRIHINETEFLLSLMDLGRVRKVKYPAQVHATS